MATGGAAADLRMPSADVARAGALRRAEAVARARLERVLAELPQGGDHKLDDASVTRALARARVTGTDYQSNGGAFVRLTSRFGDWLPEMDVPPLLAVVFAVPTMRLGAAPIARMGAGPDGKDIPLRFATYRVGTAPNASTTLRARVDRAGRLLVEARAREAEIATKAARGVALIYVEKVIK